LFKPSLRDFKDLDRRKFKQGIKVGLRGSCRAAIGKPGRATKAQAHVAALKLGRQKIVSTIT